ncbi:MAG: PGF-CTERM sorting domain-containing protein, partial [Methanosarcinaceae archaeon]|nr:PGF-CTERM sorting domain-containing protein [Methanosarcinaceae archaeon]
EADVGDTDDVIVFRALITDVFQGQVDSLAVVEGLYLVESEDVLKIETDDTFGELEVTGITGSIITMASDGAVTLSKDDTIDIAEGMSFKVANDDTLRYYPFVEMTIAGEGEEEEEEEEEVIEEEEEVVEEEEEVVEEEEEVVEEEEEVVEEEEEEAEEPAPGFEAIFAVAGLLAVAYLVRRN